MPRPDFAVITPLSVEHCPPGRGAAAFLPGDFILVHDGTFYGRLVRFGEGLRVHGADRKFAYWNHAALIVSADGGLIEAAGRGVRRSTLASYAPMDYQLVRIDATDKDRDEAVHFAAWALGAHSRYGWATIVSITLSVLTGCKLSFFVEGEFICSGLVARAMERTTAVFSLDPVHITPADLAKYYGVPGREPAHPAVVPAGPES
jgi:hypothetical protein